MRHGESHPHLRDPEAIAAGVRKLKALLPEACVPSMVLREPTCMLIDMVKGAYLVMQLQVGASQLSTLGKGEGCAEEPRGAVRLCKDTR